VAFPTQALAWHYLYHTDATAWAPVLASVYICPGSRSRQVKRYYKIDSASFFSEPTPVPACFFISVVVILLL